MAVHRRPEVFRGEIISSREHVGHEAAEHNEKDALVAQFVEQSH